MKHIYILLACIVLVGIISFRQLGFHKITYERDTIDVTVVYHNEKMKRTVPNYSTLETLLSSFQFRDDVDYHKLNPAMILSHGDVITIPIYSELACISINTGSIEDLSQLVGVGPKTAEMIIEYREQFGLFKTLEGILEVKGIGPKKFEKMVDGMCL